MILEFTLPKEILDHTQSYHQVKLRLQILDNSTTCLAWVNYSDLS